MSRPRRTPIFMATAIVALLALATARQLRAAEPPTAAEILRRAIDFQGGPAALANLPHHEAEGTWEDPSRNRGRAAMVYRERSDGAYRVEVTFERRGRKFTPVTFYDGRVCKRRFGSGWDDLPTVESAERAAHRPSWLLTTDASEARVEGPSREADVDTWRVSAPDGAGRAVLQFAQDDGRLVSMEYPGTSAKGMGTKEPVVRRVVFRDYRAVGDVTLAHSTETFEDGSPVARVRYESMRVLKEFDDEWIRVPDPTRRFIPGEELAF